MTVQFYLASGSPRRRQLLENLGFQFEVFTAEIDETPRQNEQALDYVKRMAMEKNRAAVALLKQKQAENPPHLPVLSADTSVILNNQILGKPQDLHEAAAMLRSLSGQTHQVITCLCLSYQGEEKVVAQTSQVRFKSLTEKEISGYLATGEAMDKCGAYGIHTQAGAFIEHIEGSFTGIMGLPVFETVELLKQANVNLF